MIDYYRLSQEELENRINATRAYIHRQAKREEDSRSAEVELCYLEREEEHRSRARELHKQYVADLERLRREEEEALRENYEEESAYDA